MARRDESICSCSVQRRAVGRDEREARPAADSGGEPRSKALSFALVESSCKLVMEQPNCWRNTVLIRSHSGRLHPSTDQVLQSLGRPRCLGACLGHVSPEAWEGLLSLITFSNPLRLLTSTQVDVQVRAASQRAPNAVDGASTAQQAAETLVMRARMAKAQDNVTALAIGFFADAPPVDHGVPPR